MPMRAAIFDFGGVLTTDPLAGLQRYEDSLGVTRGALLRLIRGEEGDGPWQRLERGELAVQDLWEQLKQKAQSELGVALSLESLASSFSGTWGVREKMVDLVRELGDRVVLVLLTNNIAEFAVVWKEMIPVDDLFDAVIDSSAVGLRKPDPRIFQLALEAAATPASETFFVDDSLDNVEAARKLGITAIHFTDEAEVLARVRKLVPKAPADDEAPTQKMPRYRRSRKVSTRPGRAV
jgi:epoxide hydrolase-like predicted phosphatase